jgi:hypothetical protein
MEKPQKAFNWTAFQKTLGYTDEELTIFKADPRRYNSAQRLFTREIADYNLIIEVVESKGCSCRLKPGDRLVFRCLSQLDLSSSAPNWCAHAFGPINLFASMAQDRFVSGLPIDDMTYNHFSCGDTGVRFGGWGQVIMKAYVEILRKPAQSAPKSPSESASKSNEEAQR